jgi:hypothetical protein
MVQKACDDIWRVCGRREHLDHSPQHPQWPLATASEMDCCTVEKVWPSALAPQTCLNCVSFPEGGNCLSCNCKWQLTSLTNFCSWHSLLVRVDETNDSIPPFCDLRLVAKSFGRSGYWRNFPSDYFNRPRRYLELRANPYMKHGGACGPASRPEIQFPRSR